MESTLDYLITVHVCFADFQAQMKMGHSIDILMQAIRKGVLHYLINAVGLLDTLK